MSSGFVLIESINFQFGTEDPFIACMYHEDDYPKGKENLGPDLNKYYRPLGQDFSNQNGFNMYYGEDVPGYPVHPHKGFESVSILLEGVIDYFDSRGGEARYADGDVQWITTGKGYQHAEMFPLVFDHQKNPFEMFQIWLNLTEKNKDVEPFYKMIWHEEIPVKTISENGRGDCILTMITGSFDGFASKEPPKCSWASDEKNQVKIILIEMEPHAQLTLQQGSETMNRNIYYYKGLGKIEIEKVYISSGYRIKLRGDEKVTIHNGKKHSHILLLEGEPINEPISRHGSFVMNSDLQIKQAINDYRQTQFGGWPWKHQGPVHEEDTIRFAKYLDGRVEKKYEY